MPKKSILLKPSQNSKRATLLATVSRRGDVARLSLKTAKGEVLRLTLGPLYHARLIRIDSRSEAREISVSTARSACAIVTTDLKVTDGRAVCNLTTRYGTRTVRKDATSLEKDHVRRVVHWDHGNGVSAEAKYSEWQRVLQFRDNSNELARYETRGEPTENGWRSSTEYISAPAGSESYDFGRAGNFGPGLTQGFVVNTGGEPIIHMVSQSADGKHTFTYDHSAMEPPDQGDGSPRTVVITSYTQVDGTTGAMTSVNQLTNSWESGATSVTTVIVTFDPSAGTQTKTVGVAEAGGDGVVKTRTSWSDGSNSQTTDWSNDGNGHETELTTTTHSDGSSERSSTVKDGQGNESNSTVSYNSDGSFSISTTSKGSDGSETTNTQDYDKDGNPKGDTQGSGGGVGSGSGDNSGSGSGSGDEKGLPADDGSSGSPTPNSMGAGGHGELPADDGSDPAPRPNMTGPGAAAFQRWMDSVSPFLGGSAVAPLATHGNPASQIVAAMDDEGDGVGTGEQANGDGEFRIDLRAVVLGDRDPENDPRALVAALQQLAGLPQGGAAMRAAEHLLGQLDT